MLDSLKERLYALLPSIYRQRDQAQGEALRALMSVLESEFQVLEADMDTLYENWFIETAQEWVVPYIGDLLGVYDLSETKNLFFSQRRRVANTIGYRRRKGLPAVLEHVVHDVTGWPACVVEYRQLLAATQHSAHVRPGQGSFIDLRQQQSLARLNGPFEAMAHTVDVRHIGVSSVPGAHNYTPSLLRGKYRPEGMGLFLWRLQSYQVLNVQAASIVPDPMLVRQYSCFTFDPTGRNLQLFSLAQEIDTLTARTTPLTVPEPISRVVLANDLRTYEALPPAEQGAYSVYYGPGRSFSLVLNGHPIAPAALISTDLSEWQAPQFYGAKRVAVDPVLGRILILDERGATKKGKREPDILETTYCYGLAGDVGGGPYIRQLPPAENYVITVKRGYDTIVDIERGSTTSSLKSAIMLWEDYCKKTPIPRCTIRILDNLTYHERNLTIILPENSQLAIEAGHGLRPPINPSGNVTIRSISESAESASLLLNGLFITSPLRLRGHMQLEMAHCTLIPHGIETHPETAQSTNLRITIDRCIVGPIQLRRGKGILKIRDSIIDGLSQPAIDTLATSPGASCSIERSTIFGRVRLRQLELASEVIFVSPVYVQQRQHGLLHFSYVPAGSLTPRRNHCQPVPLSSHLDEGEQALDTTGDEATAHQQQIYPLFTSSHYGDPGYAQLSEYCTQYIRRGGEDGSEMGVFASLQDIQRQDNLYHILNEYFPFNQPVNVFFVT